MGRVDDLSETNTPGSPVERGERIVERFFVRARSVNAVRKALGRAPEGRLGSGPLEGNVDPGLVNILVLIDAE